MVIFSDKHRYHVRLTFARLKCSDVNNLPSMKTAAPCVNVSKVLDLLIYTVTVKALTGRPLQSYFKSKLELKSKKVQLE